LKSAFDHAGAIIHGGLSPAPLWQMLREITFIVLMHSNFVRGRKETCGFSRAAWFFCC
jgi:hypothetical protein